jgi:hypothetical protein
MVKDGYGFWMVKKRGRRKPSATRRQYEAAKQSPQGWLESARLGDAMLGCYGGVTLADMRASCMRNV